MKSWNHKPTFINSHQSGRTGLKSILKTDSVRVSCLPKWWPMESSRKMVLPVVLCVDVTIMLLWRVDQFTRPHFLLIWVGETISHGTTVILLEDFRTTVKVSGLDRVEFQFLPLWNFRSPKVNRMFFEMEKMFSLAPVMRSGTLVAPSSSQAMEVTHLTIQDLLSVK